MTKTTGFRDRVLELVATIPEGRVMTYGQLALVAGMPRHSRAVGDIMHGLGADTELPWWRVINASGKISTYKVGAGEIQRGLLEREGVKFDANGKCNLSAYRFEVTPDDALDEED